MCVEVVSEKEFNESIKIKFNNILDGFDSYSYVDIHSIKDKNEEIELDYIKSIEEFYDLNEGDLIIDFYKNNLTKDSIDFIKNNLEVNDIIYFDKLINVMNNENIYYRIKDKNYLPILIKLCTRELFFITFYFYKYPVTLWGNYNLRFPLFYNKDSYIHFYKTILKRNSLN